jgi:small subunit ribosomal protein S6
MKKYELMIILKPLLPEEIRNSIQQKIETLVEKGSGKIISTDVWGKRHLAYPIKKHDEGYYIIYTLELKDGYATEFKREIRLTSDVLRLMLSKVD